MPKNVFLRHSIRKNEEIPAPAANATAEGGDEDFSCQTKTGYRLQSSA